MNFKEYYNNLLLKYGSVRELMLNINKRLVENKIGQSNAIIKPGYFYLSVAMLNNKPIIMLYYCLDVIDNNIHCLNLSVFTLKQRFDFINKITNIIEYNSLTRQYDLNQPISLTYNNINKFFEIVDPSFINIYERRFLVRNNKLTSNDFDVLLFLAFDKK